MSIEKLGQYFVSVEDPRCSGKVEHRLVEVLMVVVCAVIACAESWDDIALCGRSKLAWLRTFLELANGIPSHDTFRGHDIERTQIHAKAQAAGKTGRISFSGPRGSPRPR